MQFPVPIGATGDLVTMTSAVEVTDGHGDAVIVDILQGGEYMILTKYARQTRD